MYKNYKTVICMIIVACIFLVSYKATDNSVEDDITEMDTKSLKSNEIQNNSDTIEGKTIIDLGNLKGLYSNEWESQAKLILMISNQSFYMDSVNLSIYVDEELLVEDTYLVEDQHNYRYYYIVIEEGDHEISVQYNGEIIGKETIEIIDNKPTFVALSYWEEKDTEATVHFYVSDKPILIK
ncbi:hypothetical protein [Vallitalea okinawensis]|uniref:hypothetical protein n=1 Tax=Vallitalea okinawensis TaxID=2078660 RepID=UPI000CFC19F8|nr:hypothetical protein [Vallitalea okinawensis]